MRRERASWYLIVFWLTSAVYLALIIAVVVGSPLAALDHRVAVAMHLGERWPQAHTWVWHFEIIAQRGPLAAVAIPWMLWRSFKLRSARPLTWLLVAMLLLNVSVGAVKLMTGRLGPLATMHAVAVFDSGDIFPSGHTSNAVVMYGILAWTALSYRRAAAVLAAVASVAVGVGTVVLDTHWVTDVLGGWLAGALVLMATPWLADRIPVDRWLARLRRRAPTRRLATGHVPSRPRRVIARRSAERCGLEPSQTRQPGPWQRRSSRASRATAGSHERPVPPRG